MQTLIRTLVGSSLLGDKNLLYELVKVFIT
jgi:hypothetical protein